MEGGEGVEHGGGGHGEGGRQVGVLRWGGWNAWRKGENGIN